MTHTGPTITRHTDVAVERPAALPAASLPPVDWASIGRSAPARIAPGERGPDDPLPEADIVILTWTSAEWFAPDHVFVNSGKEGDYAEDHERMLGDVDSIVAFFKK
jgi:hypothetical protein